MFTNAYLFLIENVEHNEKPDGEGKGKKELNLPLSLRTYHCKSEGNQFELI